jgi:putative spermidine/putrescine transport system permease protein
MDRAPELPGFDQVEVAATARGWALPFLKKRPRLYTIGASGLGLVPAVIAFAIAVMWPAVAIFQRSLQPNPLADPAKAHGAFDNYAKLFSEPLYVDAMIRTFRVSVICTVASIVISLAIVVGLTAYRRKEVSSIWIFLLIAPILSGPIIIALGWIGLFVNDGVGFVVVNAFRALFGYPEGRVLDTEVAMTIGTIHFVVPFAVLTLYPVARAVPRELLDVSLSLGVKPIATLWYVYLPMCRSGLVAASIIALAMALSAFVNAQFLGGERNLVLTTLVSQLMNTFNPTLAAAASAVLVVLGLVLVGAYGRMLARLERKRT